MKRIVLAFVLLLFIPACAQLPVGHIVNSPLNPITRERLYAAEASYKVANDAAYAYVSLRQCRKSEVVSLANPCRRYSTTLVIQAASRKVNSAFVAARKCMKDTSDSTDCVSGIESAISEFRGQIAQATGSIQ